MEDIRKELLETVEAGLGQCQRGIATYMEQGDYHSAESCLKVAKQLNRTRWLLSRQEHRYRPDFT